MTIILYYGHLVLLTSYVLWMAFQQPQFLADVPRGPRINLLKQTQYKQLWIFDSDCNRGDRKWRE
jgi:hypothetical protein